MVKSRGKRVAAWCGLVAVVVLALVAVALRHRIREHWEIRRLYSEDVEVRDQALAWLVEHGSLRAIPDLLDLLKPDGQSRLQVVLLQDDGTLYETVFGLVPGKGWSRDTLSPLFPGYRAQLLVADEDAHFNAGYPETRVFNEWVPIPSERHALAEGLWRIVQKRGKESARWLLRGFNEDDWVVRCFCGVMLGKLGSDVASVIPALQREYKHAMPFERTILLNAMDCIAPEDLTVSRTLKEALSDPHPQVAHYAAESVTEIESTAPGPKEAGE